MLGGLRTLKMTRLQRVAADERKTVLSGVRAGSSVVEVKVFFTSLWFGPTWRPTVFRLELFPSNWNVMLAAPVTRAWQRGDTAGLFT